MALDDLYRIELQQTLQFQKMINVFHYRQSVGAGNATNLVALFQSTVVNALAACQSDDVSYDYVRVYNLNNELDVAEDTTVVPSVGGIADTHVPMQLALSFRASRPSIAFRYSWKRFGGIASGLLVGNLFDIGNANVVALNSALAVVISGGVSSWVPCQVSYDYPGNGAPPTVTHRYDISGWLPVAEPATQNTRKPGRGI